MVRERAAFDFSQNESSLSGWRKGCYNTSRRQGVACCVCVFARPHVSDCKMEIVITAWRESEKKLLVLREAEMSFTLKAAVSVWRGAGKTWQKLA